LSEELATDFRAVTCFRNAYRRSLPEAGTDRSSGCRCRGRRDSWGGKRKGRRPEFSVGRWFVPIVSKACCVCLRLL
jgi:hypothetical protein